MRTLVLLLATLSFATCSYAADESARFYYHVGDDYDQIRDLPSTWSHSCFLGEDLAACDLLQGFVSEANYESTQPDLTTLNAEQTLVSCLAKGDSGELIQAVYTYRVKATAKRHRVKVTIPRCN